MAEAYTAKAQIIAEKAQIEEDHETEEVKAYITAKKRKENARKKAVFKAAKAHKMITPPAESLATRSSPPYHEPINSPFYASSLRASSNRCLRHSKKSMESRCMEHTCMTFCKSVEPPAFHMNHAYGLLSFVDEPHSIG